MAAEMTGRLFSPVWLPAAGVRPVITGSSFTEMLAVAVNATSRVSVPDTTTWRLSPATEAAGISRV